MFSKNIKELVVVLITAVQFLGMLIFAYGYFTVDDKMLTESEVVSLRSALPEVTQTQLANIQIKCSPELSRPVFDKLVFVVIDALRADFIPSITSPSTSQFAMPFLEKLIRTGEAISMVSEAQTPTVTMPRIKALMSGTYPSFMDLIYNLNAAKFGDDNLIEQAFQNSKRMVFYGDDTWLQMFPPSMFIRSNGTSSFFATDYVQVDTNVTENVIPELNRLDDWDILILHYLGVDHIGHSHGGASSRLMKSKLLEMDDVIKQIHEAIQALNGSSYLFVLTGDHGMTDAGNHGGSTPEESNTALIMLNASSRTFSASRTFNSKLPHVKQIDVAVTLSILLGLPIPIKSKGKIILPSLKGFNVPKNKLLCSLNANSLQMQKMVSKKVESEMDLFIQAIRAHHNYNSGFQTKTSFDIAVKSYVEYVSKIQKSLMDGKSHKSIFSILTVGIILGVGSVAQLIKIEYEKHSHSIMNLSNLNDPLNVVHLSIPILSILLLGSTSFIEMESYFWHYIASTIIVISLFNSFIKTAGSFTTSRGNVSENCNHQTGNGPGSKNCFPMKLMQFIPIRFLSFIAILVILRLTSSWSLMNNISDVGDYLSDLQKRHIASCLVIVTFVSVTFLFPISKIGKQHGLLLSGFFWVYLFRCDLGSLAGFRTKILPEVGLDFSISATMKARLVYLHLVGIGIELIMQRFKLDTSWLLMDDFIPKYLEENAKKFHAFRVSALRIFCTSWILFSALLLKVENIPLLGLNVLLEQLVHKSIQGSLRTNRLITFIVTYLTFASSAFFSQGNSNSISTIDVASGYIGLESYNLFLVGFLVASSTYCLYIYWILMLFIRLDESKFCVDPKIKYQNLLSCINFILIIRFAAVSFFSIVAFILQNHLFIWSVICPKFMYEACLTILTNFLLILVYTTHKIDY